MSTDKHQETASAPPVGSSDLLAEIIAALNTALNYWYPMRREDGDAACEARQWLFELRDKLERMSANAAGEPPAAGCAPPAGYLAFGSELGELVLLECIVRDHGIALEELAKRLKRTSELLGQMLDNIRKREAR